MYRVEMWEGRDLVASKDYATLVEAQTYVGANQVNADVFGLRLVVVIDGRMG